MTQIHAIEFFAVAQARGIKLSKPVEVRDGVEYYGELAREFGIKGATYWRKK